MRRPGSTLRTGARNPLLLPPLVLLVMAAAVPSGCRPAPAPGSTVRDSAGVRIVESRRPAWVPGDGWSVDSMPVLEVGADPDGPTLHDVVAAARLPDGGLVVADGANRLLFLAAGGRRRREAGGPGGGPGEYGMIVAAGVAGDTVWSYDYSLRRVSYHTTGGDLAGVAPLRTERGMLLPVGWLPAGGVVVAPSYSARAAVRAERPGLRRDTVPYLRFDAAGEETGAYGRFPAREYVVGEEEGRRTMATPLFARHASHALRGDRLIHGAGERYELLVIAPSGAVETVIRRMDAGADVSVTRADRDRELAHRLAGHGDDPGVRRFLAELPGPATRPAHGLILVDAEDHLWVAPWGAGEAEPAGWSVFDPEGRWLGRVEFPARFRPLQILVGEVVGVRRDRLDVEHLQVLRLRR